MGASIILSSILNSPSPIPLFQCPVIWAANTMTTKAAPTAMASFEACQARGPRPAVFIERVPAAGQVLTQSRQPLHSGLNTSVFLCTGRWDGQIRLHFRQLVQVAGCRSTAVGLNRARMPIKAPYGHRYQHQKFLSRMERTSKTKTVTRVTVPIRVKKWRWRSRRSS